MFFVLFCSLSFSFFFSFFLPCGKPMQILTEDPVYKPQYKVHGIKTSSGKCFYFDLVSTHDTAPLNRTSLIIEEVNTFSGCLPPEAVTRISVENSQLWKTNETFSLSLLTARPWELWKTNETFSLSLLTARPWVTLCG